MRIHWFLRNWWIIWLKPVCNQTSPQSFPLSHIPQLFQHLSLLGLDTLCQYHQIKGYFFCWNLWAPSSQKFSIPERCSIGTIKCFSLLWCTCDGQSCKSSRDDILDHLSIFDGTYPGSCVTRFYTINFPSIDRGGWTWGRYQITAEMLGLKVWSSHLAAATV